LSTDRQRQHRRHCALTRGLRDRTHCRTSNRPASLRNRVGSNVALVRAQEGAMRCRAIVWVFGLLFVLTAGARTPGTAASVVDIKLRGAYFSEPATLQMTVTVERNDANRTLWIEADGEGMYTASEIPLNGANEKRLHQ